MPAQRHCFDYEVSEAGKCQGSAGEVERRGVVIDGPRASRPFNVTQLTWTIQCHDWPFGVNLTQG